MKKLGILLILVAIAALSINWKDCINAEGEIIENELSYTGFEGISLNGNGKLYVTQGNGFMVKVKTHSNLFDNLDVKVKGGKLSLGMDKCVKRLETLEYHVTLPKISSLAVSGSGDIITKGPLQSDDFGLSIAGSGDAEIEGAFGKLSLSIAGSGSAKLKGSAESSSMSIAGSGDIDAENMVAKDAKVKIAGSGDVEIHSSKNLSASISGSGDIVYHGSPEIKQSIAGSGSLRKAN